VSTWHKLLLVAVIAGAAIASVTSGLERGIKLLSHANMALAAFVLIAVLLSAPLEPILRNLSIRVADYVRNLAWLTYETSTDESVWASSWTTFYWGWWISWTPFVGLFIARISRGRTVREFILGVLLVPTGITVVWLSVMGGAAFSAARAAPQIIEVARATPALSVYSVIDFLQSGGFATTTAAAATLLVAVFFVTSADSGTLVVTTIQAGGDTNPPIRERVQWGVGIGAVAAALLVAGGLGALQAVAIAAALPFALLLIALSVGLVIALRDDVRRSRARWFSRRPSRADRARRTSASCAAGSGTVVGGRSARPGPCARARSRKTRRRSRTAR
jgi:choline/glycine/proline betaine transport protein